MYAKCILSVHETSLRRRAPLRIVRFLSSSDFHVTVILGARFPLSISHTCLALMPYTNSEYIMKFTARRERAFCVYEAVYNLLIASREKCAIYEVN